MIVMSVITSFVNVIAGASVLLGGKAFMDEKITADGPSIRKVVGVPLLGVGALGILVSYVRNKRVREDKKAESDFYEAELYDAEEDDVKEYHMVLNYGTMKPMKKVVEWYSDEFSMDEIIEEFRQLAINPELDKDYNQLQDVFLIDADDDEVKYAYSYVFNQFYKDGVDEEQRMLDETHSDIRDNIGSQVFRFKYRAYDKESGEMIHEDEIEIRGKDENSAKNDALVMLEEGGLGDEEFEIHSLMVETFGAESKFDKLEDEIAAQYRKKGMSKEEADRIGAATAAKIGFKKYGKKGMVAKAKKGRRAETFDAEGGIVFADVPRETLGGTNNNPVRIIVGGPPHSGKSTLMNLIEDKMNQYGVSVELRDLDFSAPTDLKGGFDEDRKKIDWTPELAEEAATYFDEDSENRVILGDSIGLISRINEIVSEPADVAILLVSGSQGDDDRTYRDAIKKWMQYYDDIDKPVLMVIRSSMNPEDMNYFDPHDNYGVIVGLDRNAYNQGGDSNEISLENACLEGIVFEIAQEFDLGLANRSTRRHIDIVEESWPSIRGKPTWNPMDAGKPHLARIEDEYFEELKRRKMGE
jgi:hypothetical protein